MSLLELKDIGKIYVSENNVSVGIRGVNLSFERGEFVAITGQSGSGKSTLLNVISGMDSYEEGELLIEGNETSHFIQPDWEKYREKYISFIFQEYNIIDSFTVLENVELALNNIQDKKIRRQKAIELLEKVGMKEHLKHKGSHLSGGQKQRTVIARALAKDSPIILADEPTGNLDAATSKEIIKLLKEVSKDKLLIVVTHNFEEVSECATREIRVFDGTIASDKKLAEPELTENKEVLEKGNKKHSVIKNGIPLGWAIFKSKPKLSAFLCILIALAATAIFFSFSSFWGEIRGLFFSENYMFNDIPGRVVVINNDGSPMTEERIKQLAADTGAKDYTQIDYGYDKNPIKEWLQDYQWYEGVPMGHEAVNYTYGKDYGNLDIGRYPQEDDEVVIRVPYLMREKYGEEMLAANTYNIQLSGYGFISYKIVGVSYYIDPRIQGELLFTKEGYMNACALGYIFERASIVASAEGENRIAISCDNNAPEGKIICVNKNIVAEYKEVTVALKDAYNFEPYVEIKFEGDSIVYDEKHGGTKEERIYYINPRTLAAKSIEYITNHYKQGSLFYETNSQKNNAIKELKAKGCTAVSADTRYKVISHFELIEVILIGVMYLAMWTMVIVFLAFFIRICTKKSMDAFKPDIAIMRSMGIRVFDIKVAIYFRILICMVPTLIALPIFAEWLFRTDFGGRNMMYVDAFEYFLIFVMLTLVVMRVTIKHVKNLFSENVRKALKGGNE